MRTESNVRAVPALIARLYQIVRDLNDRFPDRPFTPDGHLVGSIGEVVAAETYDLTLETCSNAGFDAKTRAGKSVEIKLTEDDSVSLSSDCTPPDFLIVLKLATKAGFSEIYNGEFPVELWNRKRASKRKVVNLRLNKLKKLKPGPSPQAETLSRRTQSDLHCGLSDCDCGKRIGAESSRRSLVSAVKEL